MLETMLCIFIGTLSLAVILFIFYYFRKFFYYKFIELSEESGKKKYENENALLKSQVSALNRKVFKYEQEMIKLDTKITQMSDSNIREDF